MAERLVDLFIADGVDEKIVGPLCRGLGPFNPAYIENAKRYPGHWRERVQPEVSTLGLIAMFTSDNRFHEYVISKKRLMYVRHAEVVIALYGSEYPAVVEAFRSQFRHAFLNDPKPWALKLFEWDNTWCHDREIGLQLLEELRQVPTREKSKAVPGIPLIEDKLYNEHFLFPALVGARDKLDNQQLIDLIDGLGISGLDRSTIKTTFLLGRGGKGGLTRFEPIPEPPPHSADLSPLGRAFGARLNRAFSLLNDFADEMAKKYPTEHTKLSELFEMVDN